MSFAYSAPIRDYEFLLEELIPRIDSRHISASPESLDILRGCAQLCESVLAPLNRSGDEAGCVFTDGMVTTPEGFAGAYAIYCENGWTRLDEDSEFSATTIFCVDEMLGAANLSFSNYLGPTKRVAQLISSQPDERLKDMYLEDLRSGIVTGTLCLTEPQCGTDLGLIATRAEPREDGEGFLISGQKIFVTSGQHDLTSNIVHAVLARTLDAPAGTKGLSLFLVPKMRPGESGTSQTNNVRCIGIEHKMGLRASATCSLQFEGATAYLIGNVGEGLRRLFPTMERERLVIALQSLGLAENSLQKARHYARERLQGRAAGGIRAPSLPADPIIVHADIRRMLLTMKAYTEGSRAILAWTASQIDGENGAADVGAQAFVQLMTPMIKAFVTDLGSETTNLGIQIFGGHGYIREWGVEQLARDARVTQLYAGANGVQALDLIGRKLAARDGQAIQLFISRVEESLAPWSGANHGCRHLEAVGDAMATLRQATAFMLEQGKSDPHLGGAVGHAYLHLFGHVALAYVWALSAMVAERALADRGGNDAAFYQGKIAAANFYFDQIYPQIARFFSIISKGSGSTMAPEDKAF